MSQISCTTVGAFDPQRLWRSRSERDGRGRGDGSAGSALDGGRLLRELKPCLSLQVCELVKFMIEHCRQILGDDPSSLFGGRPPEPSPEETGSG